MSRSIEILIQHEDGRLSAAEAMRALVAERCVCATTAIGLIRGIAASSENRARRYINALLRASQDEACLPPWEEQPLLAIAA